MGNGIFLRYSCTKLLSDTGCENQDMMDCFRRLMPDSTLMHWALRSGVMNIMPRFVGGGVGDFRDAAFFVVDFLVAESLAAFVFFVVVFFVVVVDDEVAPGLVADVEPVVRILMDGGDFFDLAVDVVEADDFAAEFDADFLVVVLATTPFGSSFPRDGAETFMESFGVVAAEVDFGEEADDAFVVDAFEAEDDAALEDGVAADAEVEGGGGCGVVGLDALDPDAEADLGLFIFNVMRRFFAFGSSDFELVVAADDGFAGDVAAFCAVLSCFSLSVIFGLLGG